MDMSSTKIQTFLCITEALRRVSWFIVKVPFYVHATVYSRGSGPPLYIFITPGKFHNPIQLLPKNALKAKKIDFYYCALYYKHNIKSSHEI